MKRLLLVFIVLLTLTCISCESKPKMDINKMYDNINEYTYIELAKLYSDSELLIYEENELDPYLKEYYDEYLRGVDFQKIILIHVDGLTMDQPLIAISKYRMINTKVEGYFNIDNLHIYNISASYTLFDDYNINGDIGLCMNDEYLVHANMSTELNVPQSVKKIVPTACYRSKTLEVLQCNSSLEVICTKSFSNCYNLKKCILNNNLKKIEKHAFFNCVNLEYVVIPASVEEIESEVFTHGKIFLEGAIKEGYAKDFASGEATVYYKGQWEYNSEGIPTPR